MDAVTQQNTFSEQKNDATLKAFSTPRRVPLPLRAKGKEELDWMENMGVVSQVSSPTEWCVRAVVIVTLNDLRVCVMFCVSVCTGWSTPDYRRISYCIYVLMYNILLYKLLGFNYCKYYLFTLERFKLERFLV